MKQLLIANDHRLFAESLRFLLSYSDDYRVAALRQQSVDFLVLDVTMPGLSGVGVAQAGTYTFRKIEGQWKHVAMQHTKIDYDVPGQMAADEAAIRAVLEGHSQAVLNADVEKAISYFANSPNTVILYQQPGGGYIRGYKDVTDVYRKVMAGATRKDEKLTTADYHYQITGSSAFVTYIETYLKPDGGVSRTSNKANYMEKEGGQWKMVSNFWMDDKKAK